MEILLNPGPVNISDRVRRALLKPDICHREIEFSQLQNSIRGKLIDIYDLDPSWAAVLLTGSGTAAVEAMLTSFIGDNDKILIIENGVYGERMTRICQIHNIKHLVQHQDWEDPIDVDLLSKNLKQEITYLALVHHETTTGRLNRLDEIAQHVREHDIPVLLDGVSSFGAEEIQFKNWNIAACAATANKCLHGVPGISFVIVDRHKLELSTNIENTLYMDLSNYIQLQDKGGTPFTQSVQVMYALEEALNEHAETGGWKSRKDSYQAKMNILNRELESMEIKSLIKQHEYSSVLNTFLLPEGVSYQEFHGFLKKEGFVIYSGQGDLAKKVFRVSLMGAVSEADIKRFLQAVRSFLDK